MKAPELRLFSRQIILILIPIFVFAVATSAASLPSGSWEAWIKSLKNGGRGGLPGRPDSLELGAALPVWVDCHLSWFLDQPKSKKNPLFSKIVLRSTAKVCQGQLEEWAP